MRLLPAFLLLLVVPTLRAQTVPDTTTHWRYYPVAVGNAWEYRDPFSGRMLRRDVLRDTLVEGRTYVLVQETRYDAGGTQTGQVIDWPIRYDTTTARVRAFTIWEGEMYYHRAPCPFDAPFNALAGCFREESPIFRWVSGGYDGVLVFHRGGETDTLRDLSHKTYEDAGGAQTFVAGFGEVAVLAEAGDFFELVYARINGVEHGEPRFPVAAEPASPPAALVLSVSPNPARGEARVVLTLPEARPIRVEAFDALGRRVALLHEGLLAAGPHAFAFRLPPGVYFVRASGPGLRLARLLTVLR